MLRYLTAIPGIAIAGFRLLSWANCLVSVIQVEFACVWMRINSLMSSALQCCDRPRVFGGAPMVQNFQSVLRRRHVCGPLLLVKFLLRDVQQEILSKISK